MASNPKIVESSDKLKDSAVRIKDSAAYMERSTARVEDSADRRTELAADRTVFAAERTYAAWVRTGLVAMASGIGAKAPLMGASRVADPGNRQRIYVVQRLLFRRGCLAASLSGAAAANARCSAYAPRAAGLRQQHSRGGFDRSVGRHLVRLSESLAARNY